MIIIQVVSFNIKKNLEIFQKEKFFLANPGFNSTVLPPSEHYYDDQTYENYRQHYARMSSANYQQQQNEQQLLLLSLGKKYLYCFVFLFNISF